MNLNDKTAYPQTRTMARIYLQQGYVERAVAIYRQLQTQSPEDLTLLEEYKTALVQRHRVVQLVREWMEFSVLYRQKRVLSAYRQKRE